MKRMMSRAAVLMGLLMVGLVGCGEGMADEGVPGEQSQQGTTVDLGTEQQALDSRYSVAFFDICGCGAKINSYVTFQWSAPIRRRSDNWVGLYKVGTAHWEFVSYSYIGIGDTSGTIAIPTNSTPGMYEFRYFGNSNYDMLLAVSPQFEIRAQ